MEDLDKHDSEDSDDSEEEETVLTNEQKALIDMHDRIRNIEKSVNIINKYCQKKLSLSESDPTLDQKNTRNKNTGIS